MGSDRGTPVRDRTGRAAVATADTRRSNLALSISTSLVIGHLEKANTRTKMAPTSGTKVMRIHQPE